MKSKPTKKTAKTASQSATKKVFDVTRPGKTPVSPTSRPVIVGHKPQVKDPMMSDRDDERPLLDSSKKVTVQPAAGAAALPPTDVASTGSALASHQSETVAAPQSGPDRNEAAPASPVAGGTDGGAPGAPQASAEHDGEASISDRTRTESELAGGSTSDAVADEAATAPEVPDAEKPAESSANVATIATSSVVDDVPPPQEDTAASKPAQEPTDSGNTTSGLVFDELDGATSPDLTKPAAYSSGDTSPAAHGGPSSANDAGTSSTGSLPTAPPATGESGAPAVVGQAVVSHHKSSGGNAGKVFAVLFVLLILAIVAFDILLDMGILNMTNLPHTNFLPSN